MPIACHSHLGQKKCCESWDWPWSKMAWAPCGTGGVEGASSSSRRVFGFGQLGQGSDAPEFSCYPPPPAPCYARWMPLDLWSRKRTVWVPLKWGKCCLRGMSYNTARHHWPFKTEHLISCVPRCLQIVLVKNITNVPLFCLLPINLCGSSLKHQGGERWWTKLHETVKY